MKKILFMGTPQIGAACLEQLIRQGPARGFRVCGVVTGQDKPRGRGNVLTPTPVKTVALAAGIPVFTPETLRDEAFLDLLRMLSPDIIAVVAYGKILPPAVLDFPPFGAVNIHVSLLPRYRGAAPMQRAIINGEEETGVTLMRMAEGVDTGGIYAQRALPISSTDDFESVHDRCALLGAQMLCDELPRIFSGECRPREQDERAATYAPKITKEECHIRFDQPAAQLDYRIRGVTPIPMAYTFHRGKMLKICKAVPVAGQGVPGHILALDDRAEGGITVACTEGALRLTRLIPQGKGVMSAGDFIRGRKISPEDVFS